MSDDEDLLDTFNIEQIIQGLEMNFLEDEDAKAAVWVIRKKLGDDKAIEILRKHLRDEDWTLKMNVAEALNEIGLEKLNEEDRFLCLFLLGDGRLADISDEKIETLIRLLTDDTDLDTVECAADALKKVGERAIEFVMNAFDDEEWINTIFGIYILQEIGNPVISELIRVLSIYNRSASSESADALREMAINGEDINLDEVKKALEKYVECASQKGKHKEAVRDAAENLQKIMSGIREAKDRSESGILSDGKPKPPVGKTELFRIRRIVAR